MGVKVGECPRPIGPPGEFTDWDKPNCSVFVGNLNKLDNGLEAIDKFVICYVVFCAILKSSEVMNGCRSAGAEFHSKGLSLRGIMMFALLSWKQTISISPDTGLQQYER